MRRFHVCRNGVRYALAAALASAACLPAAAQEVVQALPGTTDADALASDMRRLASNPRDIDALVDAAQLSLRLGDMRAAAALLARADSVDPRNPRVKAGQGAILVQSERPGEALRYFAQAESFGLDARHFAADRALAYDLTGQQDRAQRDYRTALRERPGDDETTRRYALSLGISGQRAQALALLDPLVRRSDRGAWRAQAFVLAMTGDVGGATRIASTMMPGGAAGLAAFFERLPTLPAADRAFAVHFGEVHATPARLADARLAPTLPALPREAGGTLLASNVAPASPPRRGAARASAGMTGLPVSGPDAAPSRGTNADTRPAAAPGFASTAPVARTMPAAGTATAQVPSAVAPATQVAQATPAGSTGGMPATVPAAAAVRAPATVAAARPTPSVVADPAPGGSASMVTAAPAASTMAPPPRAFARARPSEDSILARIVAGLSIPASELGVEPPVRAVAAEPAPVAQPEAAGNAQADRLAAEKVAADRIAAEKATAEKAAADKLAAAKAVADKRAADRKAVADRKALAEKKAAAEKKAIADREAAEAKKLARANPERIWVQVAGGAYEGDLPKAYAAVKAKAPAVLGSRAGWTTRLRATNRVLTGPFKTDAEARAFVNDLRAAGVPAFSFTSDAGQPVQRLGAKAAKADDEPAPKASATKASTAREPATKAARKGGRRR